MGWDGVNESESIRDFNFCGTKILRTGGRLKINPGKKGVALMQRFITAV